MTTEEVMEFDKRLARLEQTVAKGFFDQGGRVDGIASRMDRLEDRVAALDSKLDIFADGLRGDMRAVLDAVTANTEEMRRTFESLRKEHEADRRLTRSILIDHAARLRELERGRQPSEPLEPLEPR